MKPRGWPWYDALLVLSLVLSGAAVVGVIVRLLS